VESGGQVAGSGARYKFVVVAIPISAGVVAGLLTSSLKVGLATTVGVELVFGLSVAALVALRLRRRGVLTRARYRQVYSERYSAAPWWERVAVSLSVSLLLLIVAVVTAAIGAYVWTFIAVLAYVVQTFARRRSWRRSNRRRVP
jgi:hypothetical protein